MVLVGFISGAGGSALKYRAFISYRRKDTSHVARWLRRRLLSYRFPRALLEQLPEERRVDVERRVAYFLDTSYQSANEDFWTANIEPALKESEYLIVLSSPSALEQRPDGSENWVGREIDTFLKLHGEVEGRRRIIVALTDGAPEDRFPGRLDKASERWDWADLRSISPWRWFKPGLTAQLGNAFLKIVACIYEVPQHLLPILSREETRRRDRLRLVAFGGVTAVAAVLTFAFVWAMVERGRAVERLEQAQRNESLLLADVSRRLVAAGDTHGGIRAAVSALPTRLAQKDRPFVPMAEEALLQAMLAYATVPASSDLITTAALPYGSSIGAVFSNDGRTLAIPGLDYIDLRDAISGSPRSRLKLPEFCANPIVAFSGDGVLVAAGCSDGNIRLWSAVNGQPLSDISIGKGLSSLELDGSGRRIAIVRNGSLAEVWQIDQTQPLSRIVPPTPGFLKVKLAPDGERALAWTGTSAVLWDVKANRSVRHLTDVAGVVLAAAFSPDSRLLATGSNNRIAQSWDGVTGTLRKQYAHTGPVGYVVFNGNGGRLLTGEWFDSEDLKTPRNPDATLKRLDSAPYWTSARLSADDRILVHARDRVRVFNVDSESPQIDLPTNPNAIDVYDGLSAKPLGRLDAGLGSHVALTSDGDWAFTYGVGAIKRWRTSMASGVESVGTPGAAPLSLLFTADASGATVFTQKGPVSPVQVSTVRLEKATIANAGGTLGQWAALTGHFALLTGESQIKLLDLAHGSTAASWQGSTPLRALVAPGGICAYYVDYTNTEHILVRGNLRGLKFPQQANGELISGAFVGKACRFAAAYSDGTARLWEATGDAVVQVKELAFDGRAKSVAAAFDTIAVAGEAGQIVLFRSDGTQKQRPLRSDRDAEARTMIFAAGGGRLIASYGDSKLAIWNTEKGVRIDEGKTFVDSKGLSFALSRDGKRFAIADPSTEPQLWDAETGRIKGHLIGHRLAVKTASFSPDGRRLATASDDKTIRLWDADDGRFIATIDLGAAPGLLAWSNDSNKLAVALPTEQAFRIFRVAEGQALIDEARAIVGGRAQ